jgi:hypothetical protein
VARGAIGLEQARRTPVLVPYSDCVRKKRRRKGGLPDGCGTMARLEREFCTVPRPVDGAAPFYSVSGLATVFHQLLVRHGAHPDANVLLRSWPLNLERSLAALSQIS